MDSKAFARVEIKDAALGQVEAVFATLDVVDRDNDVTVKGAFKDGAPVSISAFGHKSWEGALPVGKGTIQERGNEAVFTGQFFLNTTHGKDHFETIKALSEAGGPGVEWSYGFDVKDSAPGEVDGKSVRILKSMDVHEVSPVMLGAGVNTRTTGVKSFNDEISSAVKAVKDAVESAGRVVALRAEKGKQLSQVNQSSLDELAAACDKLKALLNTEDDNTDTDALRTEYLRYMASNL